MHAELKSYGIGGQYVALVVGRFGEFSKDFIKLRDYIARQKAYAYVENFNSSIHSATSMFKLNIAHIPLGVEVQGGAWLGVGSGLSSTAALT